MNTPQTRPPEILLIEDNAGSVRLAREALAEAQWESNLSVVRDGMEAIDFFRRRGKYSAAPRPDLVLLDLNLPRMDGREVLAEIKADPELKSIPVVVLTTSEAHDDIVKAYELNANCFITKPVDLEKFLKVIRAIQTFWCSTAQLPSK
jgi:two-component system, chemotaxis family, response regulator Rcp1